MGIAPKRQTGPGSNASTSDLMERNKEKDDEDDDSSKAASRAGRAGIVPARGETRELMLETLGHLSRYPEFMVDVWVNYDCDINCEDVFERLVAFLVKVRLLVHLATLDLTAKLLECTECRFAAKRLTSSLLGPSPFVHQPHGCTDRPG